MNSMRIFVMNVVVIFVIIIAGFLGYYYYTQSTTYLKTNNAQVTGQQMTVTAPATGHLTDWKGKAGTIYKAGDVIGTVETTGAASQTSGAASSSANVTMPTDGTLVQTSAYANEVVSPGTPLGYAYNMNNLWITANIEETELKNVKLGQTVDVYIDALPNQTFTGSVEQIGLATASTFSLLPTGNTNANYTKVTQVVPVKISLSDSQGAGLVPGMSAEVRIHR